MARKQASAPLDFGELQRVLLQLQDPDHRGVALLACSWLEDSLGELIRADLIQDSTSLDTLFKNRGGLADFHSRIHMAYAMGLIARDVRDELDLIRGVRNDFAHLRDPISFSDQSITDRCVNLQTALLFERAGKDQFASVRDRFIMSVAVLCALFLQQAASMRLSASKARQPVSIHALNGAFSVELLATVFGWVKAWRTAFPKPA
jgi:DNA-binding MltR family transcriptional regulator